MKKINRRDIDQELPKITKRIKKIKEIISKKAKIKENIIILINLMTEIDLIYFLN
jgi:hypothetical protein